MARTYGDRRQAINPARNVATTLKKHLLKQDKILVSQPAENTKRKRPSLKVKNIAERSGSVIIEADGWHISTGGMELLATHKHRTSVVSFFLTLPVER